MWPFRKKTRPDDVIRVMDDAIALSAERWSFFCDKLRFSESVPLEERIFHFLEPMTQGLKNTFPAFDEKTPPAIFLLIVAKGVQLSGTHSTAEIENALKVQLP